MDDQSQQKIISRHGPLISSSKAPDQVSPKGNFSVEDSGPPSPHSGVVNNFGKVAPGIYRSSFPYPENIEHLKTLELKTILTLVDTECSAEFNDFVRQAGIRHIRVLVPAHKKPSVVIPIETILKIQSIMLDQSNLPMLMHCNKGKHRTGCMVATYRKLSGWSLPACITEYRKYAGAKYRPLDETYIASFNAPLARQLLQGDTNTPYKPLPATTTDQAMLPTPPASERSVDGEEDAGEGGKGGAEFGMGQGQILTL
ncbi:tyrosine-protein phosphatase siw14 [Lecanora helva]